LREEAMLMSDRVIGADGMRILVVDNYDSFVYNLVQYLAQLGAEVIVRRNDAVSPPDLADLNVDGVLISPGPGIPQEAGQSMPLVTACATTGLRAPELLHGKTSEIVHDGSGVLAGLPSPFTATRYHSLAVDEAALPEEIIVTARTRSGVVMALRHRTLPIDGVQFHPESVLTHGGHRMVANWLVRCGGTVDDGRVAQLSDGVDALRSTAFADV
jgi:para-aminobenzoate synthetase component 2